MGWRSYATESCRACEGGMLYTIPADPASRPEPVACGECGGSGERRIFIYPRPKGWRGPWPPERASSMLRR